MKLRIGVEYIKSVFSLDWFNIVMTSDHLTFASVEIQPSVFLPTTTRKTRERELGNEVVTAYDLVYDVKL